MEQVIQANHVRKVYGRGSAAVEALHDLDLAVRAGRVTGLVGHNGAGKSTFIKLALGFLRPTSGSLAVLGRDPGDPRALARLGYLPEHPSFPEYLTGREILHYVGRLVGLRGADLGRRSGALLEEVGIAHAADRRVRSYSKGMMQRLGIAQALLAEPELLVLDEPMTGLDPIGRAEVKELLRSRSQRGVAILFCSHILEDVERLCDDVVLLARGRLRYQGTVASVLAAGEPRWTAVVAAPAVPAALSGLTWQPVGADLWSAAGLDDAAMRAVATAAGAGEVQPVRLEQELADLEEMFLQVTRGSAV
jgi:ABC-2 type transport system ATP-binding protein